MNKITYLRTDDWEAYYLNGIKVAENHNIEFCTLADKLGIIYTFVNPIHEILAREDFIFEEFDDDKDILPNGIANYLEKNRRFPQTLQPEFKIGDEVKGDFRGLEIFGRLTKLPQTETDRYEVITEEGHIFKFDTVEHGK